MTIVPLTLYFKGARIKLAIGLAKGKKQYDKRATMKERDDRRDIERALNRRR
jgi:SsrA-binding protein